jgi:virginiamycin B lyase
MSVKSLLICTMAGSLYLALPARGQEQTQDRGAAQLPDGDAKETVENACTACHSLTNITNSQGHTPEEWKTTVAMMLNVGAAVPPEQVDTVTNYLIKNFPAKPGPAPALIPGNVEVSFKEWNLPTPGTRPHDLVYGAHGQPARPH